MLDSKILNKLSNIKILIVEDNEMTAFSIKQSLSLYCKRVDIARNGMEGYEKFEVDKPDVVIADINMPEMNGLEMVKLMHDISPHLIVIIMTSYDSSENILGSINQRVYSYLRKPIQIEELQTQILMATKDIYNSKVLLLKGFIYEKNNKSLKDEENKIINFTKTEKKLFDLLISNINNVVSFSIIENYVWENKSMSSEALRMCIKKIRAKTYNNIIINVQGCGYCINSLD